MFVALVAFASCQMTDGDQHEPIDIGKRIALEAHWLYSECSHDITRAIAVEWYLNESDEAEREKIRTNYTRNMVIVEEENDIVLYQKYYDGDLFETERYTTDGKRLSEGGTWQSSRGYEIVATEESYMAKSVDVGYDNGIEYKLFVGSVEYSIEEGIRYMLEGMVSRESLGLVLTAETRETLEHDTKFGFRSGIADVVCNDTRDGYYDEVEMSYDDEWHSIAVRYDGMASTVGYSWYYY